MQITGKHEKFVLVTFCIDCKIPNKIIINLFKKIRTNGFKTSNLMQWNAILKYLLL